MSEVDEVIARSRALSDRLAAEYGGGPAPRRAGRAPGAVARKLANIAMVDAAIVALLVAIGLVHPIGMAGFVAGLLFLLVASIVVAALPTQRPVRVERLARADLKALPAQAERWLRQQRPALPAPAARLADAINARLETLSPQLAHVGDDTPEAGEVRKLVGDQLPAFLADYQRVPAPMRGQARNGRSPDTELVAGLTVIEQEIAQLTERLAAADLDQLSTRGRYLEMRYKDEGEA